MDAVTIDASVGGANSNSFVTRAEAQSYFEGRLGAGKWEPDSTELTDQDRALVMSTSRLDIEKFYGNRVSLTQRLSWPRSGIVIDGVAVAQTALPRQLKEACFELALAYLQNPSTADNSDLDDFESIAIDGISLKPRSSTRADKLPDKVNSLLVEIAEVSVGTSGNINITRA